ncbi:arsenic resistance N-acetyltransferase ArsN2 [Sphingosinicella sp. BN140058]|uniref:arsenic resistance N-acetyltransferase ArsN2 n=1 Tax=Sphingosinicella sp. BN140058 TaxID=1892855 RepID=UPI00101357FD|nr:arsenic resistance N-acetyltransferase ArsN2 [Sphingosinicella sp. BN140058]QAY75314.1 N-acetyltransferase [Sphingosinicella sp. BN140058]
MTRLEQVPRRDYGAMRRALQQAGLPTDDLEAPGRSFFRLADQAGSVGYVGLEGAGADRLLRSLVVFETRRSEGLGTRLVKEAERMAAHDQVRRIHLLTTGAASFFRRLGYREADRVAAPPPIATTAQFMSLCPASATYLVKELA